MMSSGVRTIRLQKGRTGEERCSGGRRGPYRTCRTLGQSVGSRWARRRYSGSRAVFRHRIYGSLTELQADLDVSPRSNNEQQPWRCPTHQRSRRGPSIAPAKVQSAIVPPYHKATNGTLSTMQWSA